MGTFRFARRPAVVTAAALCVLLLAPAAHATQVVVTRERLAPGVVYRNINDPSIPIRMYVVAFDPGTVATLDQVLSASTIGTYTKTSVMGSRAGALVAINGDLNSSPGRPTHQYALDGELMTTGKRPGISFGHRFDETGATIVHRPAQIEVKNHTTGVTFPASSWNADAPTTDEIVGYTPYGGTYAAPATNQCSARLTAPGKLHWRADLDGTQRSYTVGAVQCSSTRSLAVNAGTVVLSSKLSGLGASFIKGLVVGDRVRVGWSTGTPGAMDVVSGNAHILTNGVVQYGSKCKRPKCSKNPRTSLGVTATGRVILLVIDGRSSGSVGFTLHQLAREMLRLGAVDAVNLDGGGSATMWINGLGVVNHPTDSTGERPVSNAVVILPGADTDEPVPRLRRVTI
jgi:hypothetical protein